ncbi:MAG: ATP-dependent DNA helicase [bacterium]
MKLNPEQSRVVKHEAGALLVVAGPGSGKTRVITERIKSLLKKGKARPEEILALTFTQKAAEEMLNRLGDSMPLGYTEPWVLTFHRFADRVLQESGLELGLSSSYKIISFPQQYLLIKENLFDFNLTYFRPLGNPNKFIGASLKFFSRLQDEAITPPEFEAWVKKYEGEEKEKYQELAHAYSFYESLKLKENKLDFGDLILWCLRLFKERPAVLEKYRQQFKYILVDEFQDTNLAQFELVKLLCPSDYPTIRIVVVGDDDQAIYRFRGASLSNILEFRKTYPKAETVVLSKNYRSGQKILDSAYKLIQGNNPDRLEVKEKINKELQSQVDWPCQVEIAEYATEQEEALGVVGKILTTIEKSQKPVASAQQLFYKDFAILARSNSQLTPYVQALRHAGIPYQLIGNRGLFDQEEVRVLISLIQWLANSQDSVALFRLLTAPLFLKLDSAIIQELVQSARREKKSLYETVLVSENPTVVNAAVLLQTFRKDLEKKSPTRLLFEILAKLRYLESFTKEESIANRLKIKNINLFFEKVKQYEQSADEPNIYELADWLQVLKEAGDNPAQAEIEDVDTVNLLTIHSAKGLEFKYVFMPSLVAGRFPSINRSDPIAIPEALIKEILPSGNYHLQEERRLFYVGLTRAKEGVFLSWARDYGGARERKPSGFLGELQKTQSSKLKTSQPFTQKVAVTVPQAVSFAETVNKSYTTNMTYVSYSQLETFKQCPKKYQYRYVLGIPTLPSHSLSFGQTMHRTLRDWHREDLFKDTSLKRLLELYEGHFKENSEGYEHARHKQMRFEDGRVILERYYKEHGQKLGEPLFLEKKFTLNIEGTKLIGSIDRVDKVGEEKYEIIDYKTGSDSKAKFVAKDDQLTIYALAARDVLGIMPHSLALYFLETGQKATTARTAKQLDTAKDKVAQAIADIKTSDFPAKPSLLCKYCDFRDLCPHAYKV